MSHDHYCRNCGTDLVGGFCHECGQKDDDFRRPLVSLTNEFLGDVFQWDSRVAHTIIPFLVMPGTLTRAYMRGRRQIYVSPLRMYLVMSILFFVALGFSDRAIFGITGPPQVNLAESFGLEEQLANVDQEYLNYSPDPDIFGTHLRLAMFVDPDAPTASHSLEIRDTDAFFENNNVPAQFQPFVLGYNEVMQDPRVLNTILNNWIPRLMVILVPFFALIMAMLYTRRRVYFIDHLVFSLHFHSFAFAVLLLALGFAVLTGSALGGSAINFFFQLILGVYLYVAMLRTYRGGWFRTLIKFFILAFVYANVFFVSLALITLYGVSQLNA